MYAAYEFYLYSTYAILSWLYNNDDQNDTLNTVSVHLHIQYVVCSMQFFSGEYSIL